MKIITSFKYRNWQNLKALNKTADYIKSEFLKTSRKVEEQTYIVNNNEYRNIICSFGPEDGKRIIVGAHYDVCGNQDGADDNASGVTGLLELARLLKNANLKYRIDLVAFTLEEPPFFRTKQMGSFIHAKYLYDNRIKVKGMIALEMIGFYSNKKQSQRFPLKPLKFFYGNKGNFITIVQKYGNGAFGDKFKQLFKKNCKVKSRSFKFFASLPGIDFSDHLNYWLFGFSAIMITDTANFRNVNYHESTDTIDTLDIQKMCFVIEGVFNALKKMI